MEEDAVGDYVFRGRRDRMVKKRGYRPKDVSLRMQEDADVTVTLEKHPSAQPKEPKEPGPSDDDDRRKL